MSTAYDGVPPDGKSVHECELDRCEVAGQMNLLALHEIVFRRKLRWATHLRALNDLEFFKGLMNTLPTKSDDMTAKKGKKHLRSMVEFKLIKPYARSAVKSFARYFAVLKSDGITARSIFNGRRISSFFKSPPTTNLPDIGDVLRIMSESDFLIIGDYRHYFHQYKLPQDIGEFFGLQLGKESFIYNVLPMGWSWSPRLAQCGSMAILIEAGARTGLLNPDDYKDLENQPSFVKLRGGMTTVWYDNVIGMFTDVSCRDLFYNKLLELCDKPQLNVAWKNIRKFNRKLMAESNEQKAEVAETAEEREKLQLPTYLGLMFANARNTRSRDADGTGRMKWKHDPARLGRWKEMTETKTYATLRHLARAIGCILWDAVISCRHLCDELLCLKTLSAAGKAVVMNNWDASIASSPVTIEDVEYLRSRMEAIVFINPYYTVHRFAGAETVECASDPSVASSTTRKAAAKVAGYGYVIWKDGEVDTMQSCVSQQFFPDPLKNVHIYILEMYAALMCISKVSEKLPGCTIQNP